MSIFKTILKGQRPRHLAARDNAAGPYLKMELNRLRDVNAGMSFIYAAMDFFVTQFALSDLLVVLKDSNKETQIFRSGARPIIPDRISLIDAAPGVYCYPSLDDDGDADLLFEMCQQAFANLLSRGGLSTTVAPLVEVRHDEEEPAVLEADDPSLEGSRFGVETWRIFASRILVYAAVANIFLALLNVSGVVRFVLGLVLGLTIPGWSVVGLIHFRDTALEIALSMAASLAIIMASAQILITVHFWHLEAYEIFLCVVCLPSLMHQAKWFGSPKRRQR